MRGGCSCAGTYGHFLFDIPYEKSHSICELIDRGDNSEKPGWIRLSVHPTMTDAEMDYIIEAIHDVRLNFKNTEIIMYIIMHRINFTMKKKWQDKMG